MLVVEIPFRDDELLSLRRERAKVVEEDSHLHKVLCVVPHVERRERTDLLHGGT